VLILNREFSTDTSGVQSPSSVFGQPNSFSAINNPFLNQMPGTQHPQGFQQNKVCICLFTDYLKVPTEFVLILES